MRFAVLATALASTCCVSGHQSSHKHLTGKLRQTHLEERALHVDRSLTEPAHATNKTKQYVVDGTKIPQVPFDIGESYAGTLPISTNETDENRLYFWYFPSQNPQAKDEITIWLNGGPGCSSMMGLLQENGPFSWQTGTYAPQRNVFSWTNLTNVVWIDQPIGTGFSPAAKGAPAKVTNEDIVADDFLAFWKNFVDTFDLHGRKVYITGESYAGMYIPYISYAMLQANNTQYFDVKGIQINDPTINSGDTQTYAPAVMYVNEYRHIFGLNDTYMQYLNKRADDCGYTAFMENALTFPPKGKLPAAPESFKRGCNVWSQINEATAFVNPCFNTYHILDFCPFQWDVLGFPSIAPGPSNYFNEPSVKKAINAPLNVDFEACGNPDLGLFLGGGSIPSALGPLPHVIERTNNVIIGHGELDFSLIANGTLATIQNMTWNGKQGFQQRPSDNFFVPYTRSGIQFVQTYEPALAPFAVGAGYLGTTHTERGLTFVTVSRSGHEIPQYQPGAAYRQLEFLLGRIESLTQQGGFTTQNGTV